jgi:predicted RNase H-like nuclease (RuvC/YqgF family)
MPCSPKQQKSSSENLKGMPMSWIENLVGPAFLTGGAGLAIKWIADAWREDRASRRGEKSELLAVKTLTTEVGRLAQRVEQLEKDVSEKDIEVTALHAELDEQRRLRRLAEDELDIERRARRDLERRVADLEKKA